MPIATLRPSIGTAILLGLKEGMLPAPPTTAYLMVGKRCVCNCGFCTQARDSSSSAEMLSRVSWPSFETKEVLRALAGSKGVKRVCLQCLSDPDIMDQLPGLIRSVHSAAGAPISVSIIPPDTSFLRKLKDAGAERVGIAVDAGSRDLYDRVKGRSAGGPTDWDEVWNSMDEALSIFGKGMASTHLIIGLGETDREVFDVMERCLVKGVLLSLFAYTPMKGTSFYADPPPLGRYRAMQVVRHLVIQEGILDGFRFDEKEKLVGVPEMDSISGSAFMTRGCPDCNRPYYNERPRGPIYNHPRKPSGKEVEKALRDVKEYVEGTR